METMSIFINGLATGLILQLAVGPVFFFIINLVLQRSITDGFAGAIAVTIVDYLYIALAIFGVGKILKKGKMEKVFGVISSIILAVIGVIIILGISDQSLPVVAVNSTNLFSSFTSVFLLTIFNPMTIIFFTSLFTAKALEYGYVKNDLFIFGLGTGLATLLFMSISVILFSLIKESIPSLLIQIMNLIVGCILIGYSGVRLIKTIRN